MSASNGMEEAQRAELFQKNNAYVEETSATSSAGGGSYSTDEQQMLAKAKQQNKDTTALAIAALKTVEETSDTAANTLEELHRQDAQLNKVEKDLDQIDEDIKESKRAISFMDRCCLLFCCACCCMCDQDAKRDKTRSKRVSARETLKKEEKKHAELVAQDRAAKAIAKAKGETNEDEDANRDELMGAKQRVANQHGDNPALRIGEGLEEADRLEVQDEIRIQEDALDNIDRHLDNIKKMAGAMNETLMEQDSKIDNIDTRTQKADMEVKAMQQKMKKLG